MSFVEIRGLQKRFDGSAAVSGLDLKIERGDIYGFLGPNGAGKTTTIRMMIGLMKADKGTVKIDGIDVQEKVEIRENIGYLPERVSFYGNLSVLENLRFLCEMKGCSKVSIEELLRDFKLYGQRHKKYSELSKGMAQRVGIAQTLIGDPDLLILDEPTAGLDPNIRRWVKEKILLLKERGKTIFLSSHVLSEVQELCNRVGILSNGQMLAEDDVGTLGRKLSLKDRLELQVVSVKRALEVVKGMKGAERPRLEDGKLILYCSGDKKMDIIRELIDEGIDIRNFSVKEPDLEEVFVRLTSREER
ncbi:MAG: ATP-binding cassette domain-containing protein [Candidatus Saliniplasma sp.]